MKPTAKTVGTLVLPQKRRASALESSEQLEEPRGKRVDAVVSVEGGQEAVEWDGSEEDEGVESEEGEMEEEDEMGEVEEEEDADDTWRQRIDLRAVECCDHGVQLSTPPFPFHQYWDSQYNTEKKRKRKERSRAQRRGSPDYTVGGVAMRASPDYTVGARRASPDYTLGGVA